MAASDPNLVAGVSSSRDGAHYLAKRVSPRKWPLFAPVASLLTYLTSTASRTAQERSYRGQDNQDMARRGHGGWAAKGYPSPNGARCYSANRQSPMLSKRRCGEGMCPLCIWACCAR
jgi:hypothetical protein